MGITQVVERVKTLLKESVSPSSRSIYARAWRLFNDCISIFNSHINIKPALPFSHNIILFFVGFLSLKGFASTTIVTYVSAIGYVHRMKGLSDPTSSPIVQKALSAVSKLNPSSESRLPITLIILHQLIQAIPIAISDFYHRTLIKAMFIVAFFGLMRVGEITSDSINQSCIQLNQLKMFHDRAIITISRFKHNISLKPMEIVLTQQTDHDICPVLALRQFENIRGNRPGPLFIFADGCPVPRQFFISRLKFCLNLVGLDHKSYKSHSFRIGGASLYASLGLSDTQIRLLGRWKSDAFKSYIRCQRIHTALNDK